MALSLILISAANAPGVHALPGPIVRTPWLDAWSAPPAAPACNEVSNVLDSHMVLQQAPATAAVWGQACGMLQHATSVTVTVVLEHTGAVLASAKAPIVDGKWKASLPAVAGSMAPYTLTIAGDDGKFSRNLTDVLFGDVILCSGQSNMVFTVEQMTGAADELALADDRRFRSVRLFTVSPQSASSERNSSVSAVEQTWVPASAASLRGGAFKTFSAVCWLQGRHLFDALGGGTPVGLLASAFGGTRVHQWSSAAALAQCPQHYPPGQNASADDGAHWNAMVAPITALRFKCRRASRARASPPARNPAPTARPAAAGSPCGCSPSRTCAPPTRPTAAARSAAGNTVRAPETIRRRTARLPCARSPGPRGPQTPVRSRRC